MATEKKLDLILYKESDGVFRMYACRGEGKGCKRNRYLARKKPCDDCMGPLDEDLTLEELQKLLTQGDA